MWEHVVLWGVTMGMARPIAVKSKQSDAVNSVYWMAAL